jgi:dihydrofolate synthase / folylpolyglutamate synthase
MSFVSAVEHLHALGHELAAPTTPRRKFDLDHMRILARALGDPQHQFPAVLIAGTNGKGSTGATLAAILAAAGYRTGLYTSPHLTRVTERIRVSQPATDNLQPATFSEIPESDFARLYFRIDDVARDLVTAGDLPHHPSFFETLTALAFLYFAGERTNEATRDPVDIAILEVGMGGRLDATNIVEPVLSVITDIALDHQEYLGSTITAIAREKAGILRPNGTLITLPQHPEANQAIGEAAIALNVHAISATDYLPGRNFAPPSRVPQVRPQVDPGNTLAPPPARNIASLVKGTASAVPSSPAEAEGASAPEEKLVSEIGRDFSPGITDAESMGALAPEATGFGSSSGLVARGFSLGSQAVSPPPNQGASAPEVLARPPLPLNHYDLTLDGETLRVRSPLAGEHQQRNIALAIAAAIELRNYFSNRYTERNKTRNTSGNKFTESPILAPRTPLEPRTSNLEPSLSSIELGIAATSWPGRLEFLPPNLLLDVAHNPAGAWTLRAAIATLPEDLPRTLIFSCLRDKDLTEMAQILFPLFDSPPPLPNARHPEPLPNARHPEPLPTARHPEPLPTARHEPLPTARHSEPLPNTCHSEPQAKNPRISSAAPLPPQGTSNLEPRTSNLAPGAWHVAPVHNLILTPVNSPRAASLEDLLSAARKLSIPAHTAESPTEALALARSLTPANGLILATGSIYLVGALREQVLP